MKPTDPLAPGDVVQINPDADPVFAGCFMLVEEVTSWGAKGFIAAPQGGEPAAAYYRCNFQQMERVGQATWLSANAETARAAYARAAAAPPPQPTQPTSRT